MRLPVNRDSTQGRPCCAVIIFGGANCEGEMGIQLLRSFTSIDYVCTGEGDLAFPDFLERSSRDGNPASVPGIIGRSGAATLSCPTMVRDLDALPVPDFTHYLADLAASPVRESIDPDLVFESSRLLVGQEPLHVFGLNGLTMTYRSKSPERIVRAPGPVADISHQPARRGR